MLQGSGVIKETSSVIFPAVSRFSFMKSQSKCTNSEKTRNLKRRTAHIPTQQVLLTQVYILVYTNPDPRAWFYLDSKGMKRLLLNVFRGMKGIQRPLRKDALQAGIVEEGPVFSPLRNCYVVSIVLCSTV